MKLPGQAPIENKVVAGVSTTGLLAIIVQLIQFFWPHVNLPPQSLMLTLAAALGGLVSYYAPHTPVIGEIETIVSDVIDAIQGQPIPPAPAPTPTPPVVQASAVTGAGVAQPRTPTDPIESWGNV